MAKFQKGQSGNPKGRPVGARNKLGEEFLRDLQADWSAHGTEVIEAVRTDDPSTYLRVVAGLLPQDITLKHEASDAFQRVLEWMERHGAVADRVGEEPEQRAAVRH